MVAAGIELAIVLKSTARRVPKEVLLTKLMGDKPLLEVHLTYKETTRHSSRDNFIALMKTGAFNRI